MEASVIQLKPFFVKKPWGGNVLNSFSGEDKHPVGEMILASTLDVFPVNAYLPESNESILFKDYWETNAPEIWKSLSNNPFPNEFPLLLKILATKEPLSIQVHPSDNDLKNFNIKGYGKMESWVILDSSNDSVIYLGLKEKAEVASINEWITQKDAIEQFHSFQPETGNSYLITPGTVHGTRGEILFYEIQQPSDFTYRIYDFGRGRDLHLEKAKKVIKKNIPVQKRRFSAIDNNHFQLTIKNDIFNKTWNIDKIFQVVTFFGPASTLYFSENNYSEEKSIRVDWGDSFFFWKNSSFRLLLDEGNLSKTDGLPLTNEKDSRLFFASA